MEFRRKDRSSQGPLLAVPLLAHPHCHGEGEEGGEGSLDEMVEVDGGIDRLAYIDVYHRHRDCD